MANIEITSKYLIRCNDCDFSVDGSSWEGAQHAAIEHLNYEHDLREFRNWLHTITIAEAKEVRHA